ncbi:hypothetical protein [Flavisolibacter ginsenosidimutans]|uniref:Uncharacterized protein n=1 Tax=Flavisolibacter ginsenosidimutans TaxID=661481 RepID=A0A5B8UMK0_9BACT|nr:hypothetical protein [Flavisolibacter ginsenosidimutans]QEC57907.1 hypothetical protein FSB75_19020 [Flavisolibacter ginsenosidimutans]
MAKVRIVFPSLFKLWDFKLSFRESVVKTICTKRTLICCCSESEIELAIHAYEAKVEAATER